SVRLLGDVMTAFAIRAAGPNRSSICPIQDGVPVGLHRQTVAAVAGPEILASIQLVPGKQNPTIPFPAKVVVPMILWCVVVTVARFPLQPGKATRIVLILRQRSAGAAGMRAQLVGSGPTLEQAAKAARAPNIPATAACVVGIAMVPCRTSRRASTNVAGDFASGAIVVAAAITHGRIAADA